MGKIYPGYVNLLKYRKYYAVLQSLLFGGTVKLVVIFELQRGNGLKISIANQFKMES
jgi:hypothetical protein